MGPLGKVLPNDDPSVLGEFALKPAVPGQYFDVETGTHYNYFRDYDPAIGRYIESDPIGLKGGLNSFLYTNSPLIDIDPLGLMGGSGAAGKSPFHDSPCGAEDGAKFPQFGFGKACKRHDECYGTCGSNKLSCDLEFCRNLQLSCPLLNGSCRVVALQYCEAVIGFGGGAFGKGQGQACGKGDCR